MRPSNVTKTKTIYSEKYYSRKSSVTAEEALKIVESATWIYAVEQGEIEIPSYDNQRRRFCVIRFEKDSAQSK